jgi:hypothetical protein
MKIGKVVLEDFPKHFRGYVMLVLLMVRIHKLRHSDGVICLDKSTEFL